MSDLDQDFPVQPEPTALTREVEEAPAPDEHSTCTIYNPLGMCGTCEEVYRKGQEIGAEDYRLGIDLKDGLLVWEATTGIPRVPGGAISGYGYGWSIAMLREIAKPYGAFVEVAQ